jgi:hypothetical protein
VSKWQEGGKLSILDVKNFRAAHNKFYNLSIRTFLNVILRVVNTNLRRVSVPVPFRNRYLLNTVNTYKGLVGRVAQSVKWLATGWTVRGSKPSGGKISASVKTGPGAHPASCPMGTCSCPGVESGRGVTLTPHPLLVLRSKTEYSHTSILPKGLRGLQKGWNLLNIKGYPHTNHIDSAVFNAITPCTLVRFEGKYCLMFRAGRTLNFKFLIDIFLNAS